ncbi:hypothetical protein JCM6294_3821 [Bacteroides pyogenes DSM 20611 = JCM 6294]|uniref:Uncharacterized protein n=1 Tax=Bacteroides pyogenes DSM 20611 = JCM 6294 TaxID=1121100 RepID=W4PMC6_9BACE|nr:hypothetical protein JCM6294_3821 [Bacteroides pyogenes DSM 20611 = JCM 6294]
MQVYGWRHPQPSITNCPYSFFSGVFPLDLFYSLFVWYILLASFFFFFLMS